MGMLSPQAVKGQFDSFVPHNMANSESTVALLTLQVTKKNPLWHTVPIKIITSLILVIKI